MRWVAASGKHFCRSLSVVLMDVPHPSLPRGSAQIDTRRRIPRGPCRAWIESDAEGSLRGFFFQVSIASFLNHPARRPLTAHAPKTASPSEARRAGALRRGGAAERRVASSDASTVSEHEGGTPPSQSQRAKVTSPAWQSAWKATKSWMPKPSSSSMLSCAPMIQGWAVARPGGEGQRQAKSANVLWRVRRLARVPEAVAGRPVAGPHSGSTQLRRAARCALRRHRGELLGRCLPRGHADHAARQSGPSGQSAAARPSGQ